MSEIISLATLTILELGSSAFLFLCACADGTCSPEDVKDDLTQCLMNNHIGTFYQFPIITKDKYRNLCLNTTCMTFCMENVASPCWSQDHMVHIGNGDALTAAYLGLCDQLEADAKSTLECGSLVSNQDALNAISTFQLTLESSHATKSVNTTAVCIDWMTMKDTLDTLITAQCSGASLTYWQTFLNTVSHKCDSSLSPSWYSGYKQTSVDRCSGTIILRTNVYNVFFITIWTLMILF